MKIYFNLYLITAVPSNIPVHYLFHSDDDYDSSNRDLSDTEIVIE